VIRRFSLILLAIGIAVTLLVSSPPSQAAPRGWTTLPVGSEQVRIYRDEWGIPHIFARTNQGLFEAYGYVVAEDRLWQLELNRRAARGRLAEVFGPGYLNADKYARTVGYTDAELDAQFALLSAEDQQIFEAYRDGINRYLTQVVAPDPLNKLPFEFHALGFTPALWTTRDSVAFVDFALRNFGEIGGGEMSNLAVLSYLVTKYGDMPEGLAIFNDVRWLNDPDSPVTVPSEGAMAMSQGAALATSVEPLNPAQLVGASEDWPDSLADEAKEAWESIGVVTKLGSYAWVVSPAKSAERSAMLYGGPQMGFDTPPVIHEVQLTGGNGFDVTGMGFAGAPSVLIGRNGYLAWTSTTATGDNVDTYMEALCGPTSYWFNDECLLMESRVESINVAGVDPVSLTVYRTVHGPVVGISGANAVSQKRAHWMREIEATAAFRMFGKARSCNQMGDAVGGIVTSHNFLCADRWGNIAYWQAGQVPIRPAGTDPRLPLPGTGGAEWPGGILPMPTSVNPAQGWLTNWNNKPAVWYDNADNQIFGKQYRLLDIEDRLSGPGKISLADMEDIPKDIARVKVIGREARYLKPYLLDALDDVGTSHPSGAEAKAILEAWDGNSFANAVSSTTVLPGEVIFSTWLDLMRPNTFGDELGLKASEASSNMLLHVLDDALGGGSGVPPSRDYFNEADPNVVMAGTFDQALTILATKFGTPDPSLWTLPRPKTDFKHPIVGKVGDMPSSNRATYAQIVVLGWFKITAENIIPLGQSGFISAVTGFDPHFRDQLDLFKNFQYKPMRLCSLWDSDCDDYYDIIERILGSDPDDPSSTPEHWLIGGTCRDGLDNDKDGLIDRADRGCL